MNIQNQEILNYINSPQKAKAYLHNSTIEGGLNGSYIVQGLHGISLVKEMIRKGELKVEHVSVNAAFIRFVPVL